MNWISDELDPSFACMRVPQSFNLMTAPCIPLQPGQQSLGVFLAQTALTGLPGGGFGACGDPDADLRIFPLPNQLPGRFSVTRPSFRLLPFAGAALCAPASTAGSGMGFPNWMSVLQRDPLGCCYYLRGILGGLMRTGHAIPIPGMTPHGMYCSQTEAAVRAFQQRYRLGVTGCVDQATWQRLFPCCRLSCAEPHRQWTGAGRRPKPRAALRPDRRPALWPDRRAASGHSASTGTERRRRQETRAGPGSQLGPDTVSRVHIHDVPAQAR